MIDCSCASKCKAAGTEHCTEAVFAHCKQRLSDEATRSSIADGRARERRRQEAVANRCGVSVEAVANYENNGLITFYSVEGADWIQVEHHNEPHGPGAGGSSMGSVTPAELHKTLTGKTA